MAGRIRARHLLPYLLVLLVGIGVIWVLQRLLSQAAASDEPRQRTQAAHLALERLLSEHSRTLSALNALPAFFSASYQVSPAEFRHFLDTLGIADRAVSWVGFARAGGGPPTLYPPETSPAVWPPGTRAAATTWRRNDGVYLRRVADASGDAFVLAAKIDYGAIRQRALAATASLGMRFEIEHLPDQGIPTSGFLIVSKQAGQAIGQVSTDRWRVTAYGAPQTPLLARSRLLLWTVGVGMIGLAEVFLYNQRRSKRLLRERVKAATRELADRNLLLHGLTAAINRPAPGPELGLAICRLLMAYLPVADATVWIGNDRHLASATDDGQNAPDIELVEAWLDHRPITGSHHSYPMLAYGHLLGVLQATPSQTFSLTEGALLAFVARQTGLALESTRLAQAVDKSLQQREQVLRSMSEALAVIGPDLSLVYLNPAGERLLGPIDGDSRLGQSVCTLPLSPNPVADSDKADEGTTWLLSSSRRIPLRYKRSPLPDGGTILTLRDVSAEESATTQKAEFINLASHELRTPLTIIRSHIQALGMAERLGLPEERQQAMREQIVIQVDRLTKLVHDILDASSLATATGPIHLQAIDPQQLLQSAKTHLAGKAARKHQEIRIEIADPSVRPKADPGLLSAVLDNLLDNAINYSPPERPIILRAEPVSDHQVALTVRDQGIGIAPEDLDTVFQPFQRVQTPLFYQVRGTGLGLYLAREWTRAMGGELAVTSKPGSGSTFRISLPAA